MPTRKHKPFSITWDQVAAFRLARHHLLKRAPAKHLLTVVRDRVWCGLLLELSGGWRNGLPQEMIRSR